MGSRQCWATPAGRPRRGPTARDCCCRASARASSRWRPGSSQVGCRPGTSPCTTSWPRPSGTTQRCWIVDDTAFPKQGAHSVGVARQYCGQLGKQENCQVAVSLPVAHDQASLPIAHRLYLPETWAADPQRGAKAGVPEEIGFETKTAIALGQLRQAREEGVPVGVVLGD